ncbi:MAG: DUF2953 domain-containing protein [Ruthenibacterium sp.]
MHIALIVLLWILAIVGILAALFFVFPVSVLLCYQDSAFTAKLRVAFLTFGLYPRKPKKEKPSPKETPEPAEKDVPDAPKEKAEKEESISFDKISKIIQAAGGGFKLLLRGLHISDITVFYPVYQEDAAATAIAYGQTQAYLGAICGVLQNFIHFHFKKVDIFADFENEYANRQSFYCKIGATPFIMVTAALYIFKRLKSEKVL